MMESEKKHHNAFSALRQRDFLLLFAGQAVSSLGSALQSVALTWLILSLHGSAIDLSLALLFLTVPQALITFAGGLLIDRLDARSVMILADALRLFTAGALALLASRAIEHLWVLWVILALHGTGNAIFLPAAASIAPRLVKTNDLESANSLVSAMVQIGPLLGYVLAGLLIGAFGPSLAFACNAVSYAVAVILALLMRPLERLPHERNLVFHDIKETTRYLRTVPWLLTLFLMDSLVAFAGISTNSIGAPLLTRNVLHAGVQGYSVLAWSYSSGAVVGLLLPALRPVFRSHRGWLCIVFHVSEAILLSLIVFAPLPIGACCMFAWSLLNGVLVTIMLSLIQEQTPGHLLGRVMAFFMLASTGMLPVAQGVSGPLASVIGAQGLFVLAGSLVLVSSFLGWSVPAFRQLN